MQVQRNRLSCKSYKFKAWFVLILLSSFVSFLSLLVSGSVMSAKIVWEHDPLWQGFCRVLQFYQLPVNAKLVLAQVPLDPSKPLALEDIQRIARQRGFVTTARAILPADIGALSTPHLVVVNDKTLLVYWPDKNQSKLMDAVTGALTTLPASKTPVLTIGFDKAQTAPSESVQRKAAWFWDLFWQHKRDYWDLVIATLFINIFALITPIFSMNVYDRVVPNHAEETLWALTAGVVLAFGFNFIFKLVRGHILGRVTAKLAAKLDVDLMDHLLRLQGTAQALTVGEKTDLFREMQSLRDFFASRLMPAVLDMPFFILFLVVIYVIDPGLTLVVLAGIALMFVVSLSCRIPTQRSAEDNAQELRGKNTVLVELLSGAASVRMFNAMGVHLHRWQRIAERSAQSGYRSQHFMGLMDDLDMTIMFLINVFVFGVYEIEKGALSMGGLVAASILVGRAMSPIMALASVAARLRQSMNSLQTIDRIFSLPVEENLPMDYAPKAPFKGALELQDVTFYHPAQVRPTLYHLSLRIAPGEKVGLIGRTGAGKSTLTHMLEGNLQPQSGQVLADNMVLSSIHPVEWRQQLGVVPQDSYFFSGTIRSNILLGVTEVVDEVWLQQVLQMTGLDVLLQQAGYGLDFQIGEGGCRLSGGQKQAIALARAMVRRPQILLLDEPTNGMDHTLENHVRGALQQFARERTLVLVTHRTTLLGLVLIEGGKVAADGPRDEILKLLAQGGVKGHA